MQVVVGWGGGRLHTYRYTVTTRMTCMKVGSDESHFNVSYVRDKVTRVSTDHNFWRERRAEADLSRGPSAYQPNALPLGQTGSRQTHPVIPIYNPPHRLCHGSMKIMPAPQKTGNQNTCRYSRCDCGVLFAFLWAMPPRHKQMLNSTITGTVILTTSLTFPFLVKESPSVW